MMTLLRFAAVLLAMMALLPAQAATTKGASATVLSWQVQPNGDGTGTLWCYDHVTGETSSYPLASGNGWGNLPSEVVVSTVTVAESGVVQGGDPPPITTVYRAKWKDKDGIEWSVETPVTGGDSPENRARKLREHKADVANLAREHPPVPPKES